MKGQHGFRVALISRKDLVDLTEFRNVVEGEVRIPIQGGHVFRFDPGHPTDLMAATIPI